jgi:hypothetical protein
VRAPVLVIIVPDVVPLPLFLCWAAVVNVADLPDYSPTPIPAVRDPVLVVPAVVPLSFCILAT